MASFHYICCFFFIFSSSFFLRFLGFLDGSCSLSSKTFRASSTDSTYTNKQIPKFRLTEIKQICNRRYIDAVDQTEMTFEDASQDFFPWHETDIDPDMSSTKTRRTVHLIGFSRSRRICIQSVDASKLTTCDQLLGSSFGRPFGSKMQVWLILLCWDF